MLKLNAPDFILFEKDWEKWPTAIADINTSNQSAVDFAGLLKAMGVRNHKWPLALINPDLVGVDPYSPNLTVKQMVAIKIEVELNPWYFFREIAPVPGATANGPGRIRFNRGNGYLWWAFFNHVNTILTQPRQTGKSLSIDELMVILLEVMGISLKISLITTNEKLRTENTDRLKSILDALPPYLRNRTRNDRASSELIEVKKKNNTYTAYVSQKSEGAAHNLGRGGSAAVAEYDEPPFQANLATTYGAMIGSMGAKIDEAIEKNSVWGIIMASTAGKRNTASGKYFYQIVDVSALWTEHLYDCVDIYDLHDTIQKMSRARTMTADDTDLAGAASTYGCFSHRQLGFTDQWLAETIGRNKNPIVEDINRDFFNIITSGSEQHPLDQVVLDDIIDSRNDPLFTEIDRKYRYAIRWQIKDCDVDQEMDRRQVVAGVDMSEGLNRDFITIVFTDINTGEVIGASTVRETNIIVYTYWFCKILERFPKLVAVIERKNMGIALIDACNEYLPTKNIDPFKRLFNRIVQEKNESDLKKAAFDSIKTPVNRRNSSLYDKFKGLFGYNTAGSGTYSRDMLYKTTLTLAAPRVAMLVRDPVLIDQIAALVEKDGRIDHQTGMHDDLVIAWLLTLWFIFYAKNISYYGFDETKLLSVSAEAAANKETDEYSEQKALKQELEHYIELLSKEDDQMVILHLEQHVRFVQSRLNDEDDDAVYTFNDLIAKAKENRRKRQLTSRALSVQNINKDIDVRTHSIRL